MLPHPSCSLPVTIGSFLRRRAIGIAVLGMLLILTALPAFADTYKTFGVSTTWLLAGGGLGGTPYPNPNPVDSTSTIVLDTSTGQVVSSHVTASGAVLGFQSQQSGTGYTLLTFSGGTTDFAGDSIAITFNMYLPVASLVGYSGGSICDATNPCAGVPNTNEVIRCSGTPAANNCTSTEQGTFTANTGQVTVASSPVPLVTSLVPTAAAPGGPAFTLTVIGGAFTRGSGVTWNGSPRATTYVSGNHLTAAITAADIASAGTALVTVTNPAPGGGTSNTQYFQITSPLTTSNSTVFGNSQTDADAYRPRPSNTLTGDFNGDGKLDLVAYANGNIYFLPGNGDGTFSTGNWFPSVGPPLPPTSAADQNTYLATADLNGDGKPDLVLMNANGTFFALGKGDGTFHLLSTSLPDVIGTGKIGIGDFNGDGFLDLAYFVPSSSLINGNPQILLRTQLGNGNGTFHALPDGSPFNTYSSQTGVLAVGDFDGAGNLGIAVLEGTNFPLAGCPVRAFFPAVFPGDGQGHFGGDNGRGLNSVAVCGVQQASAVFGDFNNDGTADIAFFIVQANAGAAPGPALLTLFLGPDSTNLLPFQVATPIPSNFPASTFGPILASDLNGDGKLDLVTGNQIFYGNGDGSFTPLSPPQNNGLQVIQAGDFNGDGKVDLLALGTDPANSTLFDLRVLLQLPGPPDFSGGLNPGAQTVVPGSSANYAGTVISVNGFTGNVGLTASGLPTGVTANFNPATVTGGSGPYTLALTVANSVPLGTYTITVTGTSGSLVHSTTVILVVNSSVGDFSGSMAPGSDSLQNINSGQTATYTFQITPIGGFTGNVSLGVSGLPAGATGTFNPPTVLGGSGTSTLTVVTAPSTPTNVYTLMITDTSGVLVHTGTVFLGVRSAAGDFTGTITPNSVTISAGTNPILTVQADFLNGFGLPVNNCQVTISETGLPPGVQVSDRCTRFNVGEDHYLSLNVPPGTPPGTYTLLVTGSSGGRIRSATATVTITPAP